MVVERFKVIVKWGVLLVVVWFGSSFLGGFLAGLAFNQLLDQQLLGFLTAVVTLPFDWVFSYKAVKEYLNEKKDRYQKNIGINIGLGVVVIATAISVVITYLLTGQINFSFGILPLILGLIAGKKAENKFLSSK